MNRLLLKLGVLLLKVGYVTRTVRRHNERAVDNQARTAEQRQANRRAWLREGAK